MAAAMEGGEHGDVVAHPIDAARVARGALGALRSYAWSRVTFPRLASDGHLARELSAERGLGPTYSYQSAAVPRVVRLTTWNDFLKSRSKRVRHEMRRHIRRWEETPGASVRWSAGDGDLDRDIDTLFQLHERRFRSRRKRTQFTGFYQRVFHKRVARGLANEGRLLLMFLEIYGRPVAAAYGWHTGSTTTLYQTGFDPSAARLSPGTVAATIVLRDAVIGQGRTVLDLGEGCYEWKLRWANNTAHLCDVRVCRRGFGSSIRLVATRAVARVRALVRRKVKGLDCHGAVAPRSSKKACTAIRCGACVGPQSRKPR